MIEFWHWWVAAVALALAETLAPGAVLIWLGAAAAVVGAVLLVVPDLNWHHQLLIFSTLSIVLVVGWRVIMRNAPGTERRTTQGLNRRAEQYVGRRLILESAIVGGRGKAFVGDTLWTVAGPDLPAGAGVDVTGADGTTLLVIPASEGRSVE